MNRKNLTAAVLAGILLAILPGCKTTYEYTAADGRKMVIESYREFPGGIDITYTDDGLRIQAGEVTNGGDVEAVVGLVDKLIPFIPKPD